MKIAVIVSDATAMMHTRADLDRWVKVFELPEEIASYINTATKNSDFTTVSFATIDEEQP